MAFLSSLRGRLYFIKEIQVLWLFWLTALFFLLNGRWASMILKCRAHTNSPLYGLWSELCATATANMSTSILRVNLLVQQKLASLIFRAVKVHWIQHRLLKSPFCLINLEPLGKWRTAHRTGSASLLLIHVLRVKWVRRGAQQEMRGKRAAKWYSGVDGYNFYPLVMNQGEPSSELNISKMAYKSAWRIRQCFNLTFTWSGKLG